MTPLLTYLIHVIFWLLFLTDRIISLYKYYFQEYGLGVAIIANITDLVPFVFLFYINYSLLVKHLLKKNKYLYYIMSVLILIILSLAIQYLQIIYISKILVDCKIYLNGFENNLFYYTGQTLFYLLISVGLRFTSDWFNEKTQKEQLEKDKLSAELSMLVYQINPHFLNNTLHNINYLISYKPELAKESIVRLSQIMRYKLNIGSSEKSSMKNELEYIHQFIELQKLRLVNPDIVKFDVKGNPENYNISPMLLISFIENAFKHGDVTSESAFINIY
ncbi:histidine kinase, partial [Candidatus Kapabacteria bacterium]|nr:histidine kinase [Candidatus Kapabacteria bacterium]